MQLRKGVSAGLLALVAWIGCANAQDAAADAAYRRVSAETERAYRAALVAFAANEASAADPVEIAVARCEFISYYRSEDDGPYVESASKDYEACLTDLDKRFAQAPQSVIYRLGNPDHDVPLEKVPQILEMAKRWPAAQRAKLYASLASDFDDEIAGEYALQAVRLGNHDRVAMAAQTLISKQRFDEAAKLLRDTPVDERPWFATARVKAAMELPDRQAGIREAQRHLAKQVELENDLVVRAWLRAGKPDEAARAFGNRKSFGPAGLKLQFDVAMASKNWPVAVDTVDIAGPDKIGSLQRFGALAVAAPSTLLAGQMQFVLLLVLLMSAALALVPGLLLWPVHYRGLARRLQHRMSKAPLPRVTLWHTWYGAALALVIPTLLSIFLAPELIKEGKVAGDGVLKVMLWSTLLSLALLLPIIGVFGKRVLIGDAPLWRATWKSILGYWVLLLGIVFALNVVFAMLGADTTTEQTKMVEALAERAKTPGVVMLTLAVVALIGPIFEELVFRGLLLNGFARHIEFRWANAIQAALFACMHLDPPRFLFYFAMGLFGGWLVRRTGSIAPAIALHVLNNALAIGLLILAT